VSRVPVSRAVSVPARGLAKLGGECGEDGSYCYHTVNRGLRISSSRGLDCNESVPDLLLSNSVRAVSSLVR
jgi:hypothetical protein